jgi:hypothetical protein
LEQVEAGGQKSPPGGVFLTALAATFGFAVPGRAKAGSPLLLWALSAYLAAVTVIGKGATYLGCLFAFFLALALCFGRGRPSRIQRKLPAILLSGKSSQSYAEGCVP